ncbi:hypothetical protein RCL1_007390 [Eukaryota sp. TZLM3-RCL]
MGNEGGFRPKRSELVSYTSSNNPSTSQSQERSCSLTGAPLFSSKTEQFCVDFLGNVFIKRFILESLLEKNLPCSLSHIKNLRHLIDIHFPPSGDDSCFKCPLLDIPFSGINKFICFSSCGHVVSRRAWQELSLSKCPLCDTEVERVIPLFPDEHELKELKRRGNKVLKRKSSNISKELVQIPVKQSRSFDL